MTHEGEPHDRIAAQNTSDGRLDCTRYSAMQLRELLQLLDETRFPQNAANIRRALATLEGEDAESAQATPTRSPHTFRVRFTRFGGWCGWLMAKWRRAPFFGEGSIDPASDPVKLTGWCRTWLGVATLDERTLARGRIVNAAANDNAVFFQYRGRFGRRRIAASCRTADLAAALAAALPAAKTDGFDERWRASCAFSRQLKARAVRPWVTWALLLLCAATFLAFVVLNHAWTFIPWNGLVVWGANYGPLTTSGQWWRLLTAQFLHGSLAHLLVNLWVLWNVGRLTERLFGSMRYALIWFGAGLAASMTSVVWNPVQLSVGASGGIFGVIGAFIGYALRPGTQLPRSVLTTHWLSTTVFCLFSLINGLLSTGIDNAAHVGGLIVGIALGVVLAEPLSRDDGNAPLRPIRIPSISHSGDMRRALRIIAGMSLAVAYLGLGYAYVKDIGTDLPAPAKFMKNHEWFFTGEERNLSDWLAIGSAADQGFISPAEVSRRSTAELLPFWRESETRLSAELPQLTRDQQLFAKDVLTYVHERIALIDAVVDGVKRYGTIPFADIQAHLQTLAVPLARLARLRMDAEASMAPRALSRSSFVLAVRGWFAPKPTCVEPPEWTHRLAGLQDSPLDGPAQRHAIRCLAQRAFLARDFVTIENLLRTYPVSDLDPIAGETRHGSPFTGLDDLFDYGHSDISDTLAIIADWRRALPESDTPKLVEAAWYLDWAWQARSNAVAQEVSAQRWQAFSARLAMAQAALDEAAPAAVTEPKWYATALAVALGRGDDTHALDNLAAKALAAFPYYEPLYLDILHTRMPRWGGSFEAVDNIITRAARPWGDIEPEIYARTYTDYAYLEGAETDLFSDGKLDWTHLQTGYQGLLDHYPRSDELLNEYAYMACRANQRRVFSDLLPQLAGRTSASAWLSPYTLARCKALMR